MTYSLLAGGSKIQPYLLPITLSVVGVLLLIAFCIGFARGWRNVSWAGCIWAVATGAYILVETKLSKSFTPLAKKLAGKLPAPSTELVSTLLSVAIAVFATLLVYGIFSAIFRTHYKRAHGDGSRLDMDESGVVYDEDAKDYDDYEDYSDRDALVRVSGGKPTVIGRFFGALLCMINLTVFVGVAVCAILFVLGTTPLKTGALAKLYAMKGMPKLMSLSSKYVLDCVIVGITTAIAISGFRTGLIRALRTLVVTIGGLTAGVGAFVVPFTKLAKKGLLLKLVNKCVGACGSMSLSPTITAIVGKLLAGFLLCLMVVVAVIVLHFLFKGLIALIDGVGFFRVLDGAFATLLYFAFALVLWLVVFAIFATLAKYGILNVGKAFSDNALANELLASCRAYIEPLFRKLGALLQKLKK